MLWGASLKAALRKITELGEGVDDRPLERIASIVSKPLVGQSIQWKSRQSALSMSSLLRKVGHPDEALPDLKKRKCQYSAYMIMKTIEYMYHIQSILVVWNSIYSLATGVAEGDEESIIREEEERARHIDSLQDQLKSIITELAGYIQYLNLGLIVSRVRQS